MAGKSWQLEFEAAGHLTFTAGNQKETDAGAQLGFLILISPGPQSMRWRLPLLGHSSDFHQPNLENPSQTCIEIHLLDGLA